MTNRIDTMLPHNIEAEQAVLGAMLIDTIAIYKIKPIFTKPDRFLVVKHNWIYNAYCHLLDKGISADFLTLCSELENRKQLREAGGAAYLTSLINATPTALNVADYAEMVESRAYDRDGLQVAGGIGQIMYDPEGGTSEEKQAQMQGLVDTLRPGSATGTTVYHRDTLDLQARQAEIAARPPLISWPWPGQKRFIDFLYRGLTLVVGAETSVGKTIFMENLAEHAAKTADVDVLYYHLENTADEMLHRRICRLAGGVTMKQLRRGYYGAEVRRAEQIPYSWPGRVHYVGAWGWTASQIVADAKQKIREGLCDLVIVDYFQKMKADIQRGENIVICRGRQFETLTTFCVDTETTIAIGSQMSKASYGQKRKTAATFRGTGEIGEKANINITLDRQIHNGTEPMRNQHGDIIAMPGSRSPETTLRFDKNSGGPTGEVMMWCNAPRFQFTELEGYAEPPPLDF